VTIVSILRLQSLVHFANSSNPTWDNLPVSQWSTIEINIGIICACMPSLRVLLVRLFPKLLGTTQHSKSNGYYANNSHVQNGGNISVNWKGKSLISSQNQSQQDMNSDGITYSQTYTVQWGDHRSDHDDTKSMQMSDLDTEALKSGSRVTENEL
jgi:hypothetical protein